MFSIKKITAGVLAVSLAAAATGCTPSIGAGSANALKVNGENVPAGIFIYYSLSGYQEAANVLQTQNGTSPTVKDVRNAKIDSIDSTDWIQDKATEYCVKYMAIKSEFEAIGGELTAEELDEAAGTAEYVYAQSPSKYENNGISVETIKKIAENTYREQAVFKHYYDFNGSDGCSEEELKDYFDENFARVKYITISLKDSDGSKVSEDEVRKRRKMAEQYAKDINKKSKEMDKMAEMDKLGDEYDEYVASLTTTAESESVTTTTTTTTAAPEVQTTTTTDPYAKERLFQKTTSSEADEASDEETTTTAVPDDSSRFNTFLFNEIELDKATVYDYNDETIYVVIRGDLRARMTEDDFWSEQYISDLQSMRYYDSFTEKMDAIADQLEPEKNKTAYRRYAPFKLDLES